VGAGTLLAEGKEQREIDGHYWHFAYPLEDGSGEIVVATTRPETMLGDTAVAVHPRDARYASLIGKCVRLPIVGRPIPIIADDYADPDRDRGHFSAPGVGRAPAGGGA